MATDRSRESAEENHELLDVYSMKPGNGRFVRHRVNPKTLIENIATARTAQKTTKKEIRNVPATSTGKTELAKGTVPKPLPEAFKVRHEFDLVRHPCLSAAVFPTCVWRSTTKLSKEDRSGQAG